MLTPAVAGMTPTPGFINTAIDNALLTKYQVARQTRTSSTTYLNSDYLVFPLAANAGYTFTGALFHISGTTPDIKYRFTGPTACLITIGWGDGTTTAEIDVSDAVEQTFATSASLEGIQPSGFVSTDVTAGNFVLAFAQNTSSATTTNLEQGSFVAITRVF